VCSRRLGHSRRNLVLRIEFLFLAERNPLSQLGINIPKPQWRQREFKVGGTSLVSRLFACLTEANWWRLTAE